MPDSNGWSPTSRSASTCCRRPYENKSEARTPSRLAGWFQETFQISCLRACRLAQFSRAAWYRRSLARDQSGLRLRIRDLPYTRPRFGYLRIGVLLRREAGR